MDSPTDNQKPHDMEIKEITDPPVTTSEDAPFIPPAGPCDVGDIVRYGKKWMILGTDQKWYEGQGPDDFTIKLCRFEGADFYRSNEHWSGYRKELHKGMVFTGYTRFDEKALDAKFEKYKIRHEDDETVKVLLATMKEGKVIQNEDEEALKNVLEAHLETIETGKAPQADERTLKELLKTMQIGKVKPTNVACFALGSLHRVGNRDRSLEQFTVLLKLIELLEISQDARKVIQDPDFCPADARFFERHGFQTVLDPEGIDAVDGNTFVFHIGGYRFIDQRVMDRPWPAMYLNTWGWPENKGLIVPNESKVRNGIKNWYKDLMGKKRQKSYRYDEDDAKRGFWNLGVWREEAKIWWMDKMRVAMIREAYDVKEFPNVGKFEGIRRSQIFWRKEEAARRSPRWYALVPALVWAIFCRAQYE